MIFYLFLPTQIYIKIFHGWWRHDGAVGSSPSTGNLEYKFPRQQTAEGKRGRQNHQVNVLCACDVPVLNPHSICPRTLAHTGSGHTPDFCDIILKLFILLFTVQNGIIGEPAI